MVFDALAPKPLDFSKSHTWGEAAFAPAAERSATARDRDNWQIDAKRGTLARSGLDYLTVLGALSYTPTQRGWEGVVGPFAAGL